MADSTPAVSAELVRSLLSYDPTTGVLRWLAPRRAVKVGTIAGKINRDGYRHISINNRRYAAHRLVWLFVHGEWPRDEIDHVNGDKLDNRIVNLRAARRSQNAANKTVDQRNSSGVKGVTWNKNCSKWQASIGFEGRSIYLGVFDDLDEAAAVRRAAALAYYGPFAGEART